MDSEMLAGMAFTLILAVLVGGFILIFPLSRRLGAIMEARLEEKKAPARLPDAELVALRDVVEQLGAELRRVNDRQDFIEKLLTHRAEPRLPSATVPGTERS